MELLLVKQLETERVRRQRTMGADFSVFCRYYFKALKGEEKAGIPAGPVVLHQPNEASVTFPFL